MTNHRNDEGRADPQHQSYSRRGVLRTGAALAGTMAAAPAAGCLGRTSARSPTSYPLDQSDPSVAAARSAEKRAYEHYGLAFHEHFVDVEALNLEMRVVEIGSGPPVVMIPGGIGHGAVWLPLLPEFKDYTVYVMDRPGGGLSDGIDHRSWPLASIAASSTLALFDHFGLNEAPVIGSSMGGLWTLRFSLAHPERVTKIGLLGCPALYPGTSAPGPRRLGSVPVIGGVLFDTIVQPDDAAGVRDGLEANGHPEETTINLPDEYAEVMYRMNQLPYFKLSWVSLSQSAIRLRGAVPEAALTPDDLRAVQTPVTLLWGRNDPFGTSEQGRDGADYFADAEFNEVGFGHLPWLDEPGSSGVLLREFLARDI